MSQTNHEKFYNVDIDKRKFEPIISRQEFMEKYKDYMHKAQNAELRDDPSRNYDMAEMLGNYNEILGNFFPESLVALVGKDSSLVTIQNLLLLKNMMAENGKDLPMTIMDHGNIHVWTPNLQDIAKILNDSKANIARTAQHNGEPGEKLLADFAKSLGYTIDIKNLNTTIQPSNIKINNPCEFQAKELIQSLSKLTGLSKGNSFSYGIKGRLTEVVNQRLVTENKNPATDIKNIILQKSDIENLIILLEKEMCIKNKNHKAMSENSVNEFCSTIMSDINNRRSGVREPLDTSLRDRHGSSSKLQKIAEFFTKIASLFTDNVVTKKIESFNNFKHKMAEIKKYDEKPAEHKNKEEEVDRPLPSPRSSSFTN
ncbi:MAG: hypothetical protein JJT82_00155 [Legionellaceae bacterium]|nr:hypothetical protein [Legionellaceae bacterium]